MGKKEKDHRKKVELRNQRLKVQESTMQKLFNESMKTQIEEIKKKFESQSGETKNH
jgi:hypothetical protein